MTQGLVGPTGPSGPQGPKGDLGPQGPAGSGGLSNTGFTIQGNIDMSNNKIVNLPDPTTTNEPLPNNMQTEFT